MYTAYNQAFGLSTVYISLYIVSNSLLHKLGSAMPESKQGNNTDERKKSVEELQRIFKKTQDLPQVKIISDEMIAEEIEKTRNK